MNLEQHLLRQIAFSKQTFGPGRRTVGVSDHISRELGEVLAASDYTRAEEWVDVTILALDGLTRELAFMETGGQRDPEMVASLAVAMIEEKQTINESREWPDYRTADQNKAIEHIKAASPCGLKEIRNH